VSAVAGAVRPASAEDCARILADANAARHTVRVRGAGTKDYVGDPAATDLTVETSALGGVIDHVPADLTVTVAAGTPFGALQRALEAAGQFLPLDPPHADAATIGGIVAANSSGFWRARYGGVRDLLIGATVVLADGSVAHAGGRVVKNVAGYDLDKLLIGSLGTLGVIVECTFKVLPLPRMRAGLRARFRHGADAFAAADAVMRTPARPSAVVVEATTRDEWRLHLQASGEPSAVERTLAIAGAAADAAGISEREDNVAAALAPLRELPAKRDGAVVRASLPTAAQPAFADTAAHLDGYARLVADAASGIVRVHLTGGDDDVVAAADALLAAARVCGGSARVERRHERLRSRVAAWGDGDLPGLFLMRRLKEAFDPNGILEPGRGPVR
jgi:glycolate oxidase FAD binding subunit